MKTFRFTMALLAITVTAILGCSKTDLTAPNQSSISSRSSSNTVAGCDPVIYCLIDNQKVQQGTVTVSNDATNVYIKIDITAANVKLTKAALIIGDLTHVINGTNLTGWPTLGPGPLNPDYSVTLAKVTTYTFTVPLASLGDCFYIAIYGKICKKDAYGNTITDYIFLKSATQSSKKCWSTYVQYCKCKPPECKPLNTVTQGGYGNDQGNGNPTQYLIANFAIAFPNGITIGCANADVKFTSAAAIQAYLPTSSTPTALSSGDHFVDGNTPDNILIGQILTLGLTLGFDANDPNFGAGSQLLSDMYIQSGPYAGMTVGDFYTLANNVLGGCNTTEDPSDINDAANAINNNYDGNLWKDPDQDNGFLGCDPPATTPQ
jgi:hypothetical protein